MIITVTLNPALDKTVILPGFAVNTVNRVSATRLDPGGKGINVSKVVKALGGKTLVLGILGGAAGGFIQAAIDEMSLPNDMVLTKEITRTNIKIIDPLLQTNTDINEAGSPVSEATLETVWHKLTHAVQPGDTVVFAGKNPPGMPDERLADWITRLHGKNVFSCVDTVGEPMRLAIDAKPDIIKPNREELSELMGRRLTTDGEVKEAAQELVRRGVGLVAASLGSEGAIFVTQNQALRAYAPKVPIVSTVGAGDAMVGGMLLGLQKSGDMAQAFRYGIAAGAASVMTEGTQLIHPEDFERLVSQVKVQEV